MALKVTERKTTVTVTDTDFELVRQLLGESRSSHRQAGGMRYNGFVNQFRDWTSPEVAQNHLSKLSVSNFIFAMRLWKEAIGRINDWMNANAKNPKISYKAVVYGSEWKDVELTDLEFQISKGDYYEEGHSDFGGGGTGEGDESSSEQDQAGHPQV